MREQASSKQRWSVPMRNVNQPVSFATNGCGRLEQKNTYKIQSTIMSRLRWLSFCLFTDAFGCFVPVTRLHILIFTYEQVMSLMSQNSVSLKSVFLPLCPISTTRCLIIIVFLLNSFPLQWIRALNCVSAQLSVFLYLVLREMSGEWNSVQTFISLSGWTVRHNMIPRTFSAGIFRFKNVTHHKRFLNYWPFLHG